jgi:hypothetical protein
MHFGHQAENTSPLHRQQRSVYSIGHEGHSAPAGQPSASTTQEDKTRPSASNPLRQYWIASSCSLLSRVWYCCCRTQFNTVTDGLTLLLLSQHPVYDTGLEKPLWCGLSCEYDGVDARCANHYTGWVSLSHRLTNDYVRVSKVVARRHCDEDRCSNGCMPAPPARA